MKKSIFTLVFLLIAAIQIIAQAPQFINFQAVARNANGDPKANANVDVRFIIHEGSMTGTTKYDSGTKSYQTDDCGMFTLQIGSTNPTDFASVDWASGTKYLEVRVDGTTIGNQQMVSVPYALYAEKAKILQINLKQDINYSVPTTVRGPSWNNVRLSANIATTQITVPSDGTFLILANLKVTGAQASDEEFQFRVLLVQTNGELLTESTVYQKSNSNVQIEKGELSSWTIAQLTKGDIIKLEQRMVVGNNNEPAFSYSHGKLALIGLQ